MMETSKHTRTPSEGLYEIRTVQSAVSCGSAIREFDRVSADVRVDDGKGGFEFVTEAKSRLTGLLRYLIVLTGVKPENMPKKLQVSVMIEFLIKQFSVLTLAEIKLAFEDSLSGKLLDEKGNQIKFFGKLDCEVLGKVLRNYNRDRSEKLRQINMKNHDEVKQISFDATKMKNKAAILACVEEFIIPRYENFNYTDRLESNSNDLWVYKCLTLLGLNTLRKSQIEAIKRISLSYVNAHKKRQEDLGRKPERLELNHMYRKRAATISIWKHFKNWQLEFVESSEIREKVSKLK